MARYRRHRQPVSINPPFKPYVRFSRIRLNHDLLGVACMTFHARRDPAFHRVVIPVVSTFTESHRVGAHLAHTDSRARELSRFYRGVVGRFRHALTLTSSPT